MTANLPQRIKVFEALCMLYAKRLYYVHVRKIARRANVPVGTASRELGILEAAGIVVRRGVRRGWRPRLVYERTYRHLLEVFRRSHDFVKVQTLADLQDKKYWPVWAHLNKLRQAGLVCKGSGGYKPVRHGDLLPASGLVIEVLYQLFDENYSYVRTVEIANRLDVSAAHVRNVLRDYEEVGQVERKGMRGGWKPAYLVASAEL